VLKFVSLALILFALERGSLRLTAESSKMDLMKVTWGKSVEKQLDRIPEVIIRKFRIWVVLIEESGLGEMRRHKGFHDEPLRGQRQGQRSVRLNRAYRAIYTENIEGNVELVEVLEVSKHEY
jgi:toxin HigB-1